ncbi:MAG: sugar ABC transporter permease [Clostridia bacterium]|nr:sugar ABC transporter permease [Clostridia bacterium]
MLAWPILHFIVFWFGMNISTVFDSFFTISLKGRTFVGFENYIKSFEFIFGLKERDILNYRGFLNSLSLVPLVLLINNPLTLLFSWGIFKKIKFYKTFRVILFLPAIISAVVLCLAFKLAISDRGFFVKILSWFNLTGDGTAYNPGIVPVGGWLGNEKTMWGTILVFSVWTGVSGYLVYFTSTMARFPESVFESSMIDGASEIRQFISIAVPMVWPTMVTMSVSAVAGCFSWFMPSLLMTNGSPYATTIGLMITQTIVADESNTVICAFSVIVAVFGSAIILSLRAIMDRFVEEIEY